MYVHSPCDPPKRLPALAAQRQSTLSPFALLCSATGLLVSALSLGQIAPGGTATRPDADPISQWQAHLRYLQGSEESAKLQAINAHFNERVAFDSDLAIWGQTEYWATPRETLLRGRGDCEDFAIAKYLSLRKLGVANERLRLIYVKARLGAPGSGLSQAHMVLGYYPSPSSEPLVLDNLVSDIRPASQRDDLTPVFSFNSQGLWAGGVKAASDPTVRLSRWRHLLARLHAQDRP